MNSLKPNEEHKSKDDAYDSIGRRIQRDFKTFIEQAAAFFSKYPFLKKQETDMRELAATIVRPFNLALFGRMKTGKSSIVNALLRKRLAVTGCEETTATLNVITYAEKASNRLGVFTVHWRDSPPEDFPVDRLRSEWTGNSETVRNNVERAEYLELYSDAPGLELHEIVDTPGTGAVVKEHEKIAQSFIDSETAGRKADALVYVFGVTGRESDQEALDKFKAGCLPGTRPYNCIGVLHRWDELYWNNGGDYEDIRSKCGRFIRAGFDAYVSTVIPISAPLAQFAQEAPDEYIDAIFKLRRNYSDEELYNLLQDDEDWDEDLDRRRLRNTLADFPWICFRIIVREMLKNQKSSGAEQFRRRILALSGYDEFRRCLDENFFRRSALIRQRQVYTRIEAIRKSAYLEIEREIETSAADLNCWRRVSDLNGQDAELARWIGDKLSASEKRTGELKSDWLLLDRFYLNSEIPRLIDDLTASDWLQEKRDEAPECEEYAKTGDRLLRVFSGGEGDQQLNLQKLEDMREWLVLEFSTFTGRDNAVSRHLLARIEKFKSLTKENRLCREQLE